MKIVKMVLVFSFISSGFVLSMQTPRDIVQRSQGESKKEPREPVLDDLSDITPSESGVVKQQRLSNPLFLRLKSQPAVSGDEKHPNKLLLSPRIFKSSSLGDLITNSDKK